MWVTLLIAGSAVGLASCDSESSPVDESLLLSWSPPETSREIYVSNVPQEQTINLLDEIDYRLILPNTPLTHRLIVRGGRDIVVIGGAFKLKGYSDLVTNKAALSFQAGERSADGRIVHIEGIYFDMSDARDRDALALADQNAIFHVQNVRFENVNGDHLGLHPDAIENWGGAKEIRVSKATVITDHQGFFIAPLQPSHTDPIEYVELREIDFRRNDGVYGSYPNHKCPIYVWFVGLQPEKCETYTRGVRFKDVYATHAENCWDFGMNDVKPTTQETSGCAAVLDSSGTEMSWPTLPVEGSVKQGPPPGGEFVPFGAVGIGYKSPGYIKTQAKD